MNNEMSRKNRKQRKILPRKRVNGIELGKRFEKLVANIWSKNNSHSKMEIINTKS